MIGKEWIAPEKEWIGLEKECIVLEKDWIELGKEWSVWGYWILNTWILLDTGEGMNFTGYWRKDGFYWTL